ncbi:MAG: riboflavin synthase subunit alpha [Cellvibrionales bacterium]|nr:riboflavin synthase subunit alpha [Cellvibrionales bacterium]
MFTGIVQAQVPLLSVQGTEALKELQLILPEGECRENVTLGASIAINGVCLTVKTFDEPTGKVAFDVMRQTLDLSNIGEVVEGDWVNVERSATFAKEIGGHVVSGHIDGQLDVVGIDKNDENCRITFAYPEKYDVYLFDKGFASINGCSLTIADKNDAAKTISVCYIPETLARTNHGRLQVGDKVNLEIDRTTQAIVDTVERLLAAKKLA